MELPIITEEIIKEHQKAVEKTKKSKKFKSKSNKICSEMMKKNPLLAVEVILPTLESKKSDAYKKGYLAGITTIYDILKRQAKKQKK